MSTSIANLIKKEVSRQKRVINLIPSENYVSKDVLAALGSPLTNKYAEGKSHQYYFGNEVVDQIEDRVKELVCRAFKISSEKYGVNPERSREGAQRAPNEVGREASPRLHTGRASASYGINVQPYSGSIANLAAYIGSVGLGGRILAMSLEHGGHLTHGHTVSITGKLFKFEHYGVGRDGRLNYDEVARKARDLKPQLIVCGATAYPRKLDFKKFRQIADSVGAMLMADISHIAGLVVGGAHPNPFPYADIVTTTTRKTLRGPRGAIIIAKSEIRNSTAIPQRGAKNNAPIAAEPSTSKSEKITKSEKPETLADKMEKAVFPGLQGGPQLHTIAAMGVCLEETLRPSFKKYAKQVVANAQALAAELKRLGFKLITDGTDNHLMLVDVTPLGLTGKQAGERLEHAGIIVNKNMIPFDPRKPWDPSGIRLGTPAVTTQGMKEKEMIKIAMKINKILT